MDSNVAALHSSKATPCYEQLLKQQIAAAAPAGATIEFMSFNVTPGSAGGPANVVATAAGMVKISASGQQAVVYLSVALLAGPLIQAEVDAQNLGAPVPTSLMESLVATVANRVAQA